MYKIFIFCLLLAIFNLPLSVNAMTSKELKSNSQLLSKIDGYTEDDTSEEASSRGKLIVKDKADKTFHAENESITIQAIGVRLHSDLKKVTNIFVNGRRLDESSYTFTLNDITISGFLRDGENEISIDTLDESSLDLYLRFKILVGKRSLTVNKSTLKGGVIRVALIDDSDIFVESVDGVFQNLPNKSLFIRVKDDVNRIGVAVVNSIETGVVNLFEWNPGKVSKINNNDFSLKSAEGWNLENANGKVKSHKENGRISSNNMDLLVSSKNSERYRTSRVMSADKNSNMANIRIKLNGYDPNDSAAIVFYGLISQKVAFHAINLRYYGLTKTSSKLFESYWDDFSFIMGKMGEPVEVSVVFFPTLTKGN